MTQYVYDNTASGRGRLVARRYFADETDFAANDPERVISYRYDAFGRQVEVSDNAFVDAATDDTSRLVSVNSLRWCPHQPGDTLRCVESL